MSNSAVEAILSKKQVGFDTVQYLPLLLLGTGANIWDVVLVEACPKTPTQIRKKEDKLLNVSAIFSLHCIY